MKITTKFLAVLLMLVFVASFSAVSAEDIASEDLTVPEESETIAVDEEAAPLAAEEDETLAESSDDLALSEEGDQQDTPGKTVCTVKVEVLDKNIKVGDKFRVKVTVTNIGNNAAENLKVGLSFTDIQENLDTSFKLIDDGTVAISEVGGGYVIDFGFLESEESSDVILTFLATESGEKMIFAAASADNLEETDDGYASTTFTVAPNTDSGNEKAKASAAKTMPATGNPLALLALAIFAIVPYYRKN